MVASREDVWLALSELWLDNQLGAQDHRHIAGVLHASELPLAERGLSTWKKSRRCCGPTSGWRWVSGAVSTPRG